jgi:pyrroline-5-carboxylate reductase
MDVSDKRLGFVGAGNMAEALARGVVAAGVLPAERIVAADPDAARRAVFADLGAVASDANADAAACDVVCLAVKPQVLDAVLRDLAPHLNPEALLVSIAAGVRTGRIAKRVPETVRIVRVMPNTPMLAEKGAAGVAAGPRATEDDVEAVARLFRAAGAAWVVDETLLDAVTALSGSGPAYCFRFVEALAEAGLSVGLPRELAVALARQTFIGAGRLLETTGETAADLRAKVTSRGGTTAAGLAAMEAAGLPDAVRAGVRAARERSIDLADAATA